MRRLAHLILRAYQLFISPLLGNHCRYYPSCSQYALEAIDRHGLLCGGWLALTRLLRCHPWHPGGYDPVPDHPGCLCRPAAAAPTQAPSTPDRQAERHG